MLTENVDNLLIYLLLGLNAYRKGYLNLKIKRQALKFVFKVIISILQGFLSISISNQ